MEQSRETVLATETPIPQQKQSQDLPVVEKTPASYEITTAEDAVPQRRSVLTEFLEDVRDRVVLSLDDFATLTLNISADWKVEEEFSLRPESKIVKDAFEASLKVAIGAAEGAGKKGTDAVPHEEEIHQPLRNLLNTLGDGEGHLGKNINAETLFVHPRPVLASLSERKSGLNGIYIQLQELIENRSLSDYLAERNITGIFWGLLILFVEVGCQKKDFVELNIHKEDCPATVGRIQADNLSATPHPVSPHSASTPASAPISLRCEDEDRLHVNIWSEDKKKTVEIATVQEYSQKDGMGSGDHIEFSSRGVEDKVRFSFHVQSFQNEEWKKLFIVMVCLLKKLPCTKKNAGLIPTLYIDGIDYLQDPELFSSTFTVDAQDLIDAIYSFVGTDGCSRRVVIQSILHHAEDAVGLYAVVAEVECLCMEADCTWNGEGKIVKISFMGKARQSEQGLIGEARSKAESTGELWALNHLPEVIHSLTLLPNKKKSFHRRLKAFLKDKYEERVMHITVFEKLHPLSELEDLRDFAQVFYDILQIHQWLYECAGIFHRDLSSGNIMFRRKEGRIYGVLNDFDLSSRIEDINENPTFNVVNHTGTRPFMSYDLLNSSWKGGHLYRHDLESLFYIILCLACRYRKPGVPVDEPRPFSKWYSGSDRDICGEKCVFLFNSFTDLPIQPYFEGFTSWLWLLFEDICDGYKQRPIRRLSTSKKYSKYVDDRGLSFDWTTLNKCVTYTRMRSIMSSFEGQKLETRWIGNQDH
ncbi:protein kinase [Lentinula aff. lateritia]|uniref:Protein kinase n=1 Tax=Lentinula aff. lateritia TaxID=2804960 RepID=A0ACC1TWB5_9AGAR|nr:protein kinase [Lentinula aff. lateritia]